MSDQPFRRKAPTYPRAGHEQRDRENLIAELTRIRRRLKVVTDKGEASFHDENDETGYLAVQAILINFDDAATRRISAEVKARLANVPWGSISGMSNLLAHDYQSAQKNLVWRVATRELPDVLDELLADGALVITGSQRNSDKAGRISNTAGTLTGMYPENAREILRDEWPD